MHLGLSHQRIPILQPCANYPHSWSHCVSSNSMSWCALRPSPVLPGFSTSVTIASWDQPQLNWPCLTLRLWSFYSQRKRTQKTGLVYQPFTGYMCTRYLAPQKGCVSNKYLFCQGARPRALQGDWCPTYIIFLDITHAAIYWRILPPLRRFKVIRGHQDLEIQHTGQNPQHWMQHSQVHLRR